MITYTDKNQNVKSISSVNDSQKNIHQFLKIDDKRSEAAQQQQLKTSIYGSSTMVAQQKTIQRILGSVHGSASGQWNGVHQLEEKEEEKIQMKSDVHQLEEKEEEKLQLKSNDVHQLADKEEEKVQLKSQDTTSLNEVPVQKKMNDTGLPDNLKSGVENLSGMSLDHVKVHYGSDKPAQLNALAYAQGSDIHVAPGQEKHLPHEAWHVVQQMQGRVQPTVQMEEVSINDDPSLETEADVMGAKALATK